GDLEENVNPTVGLLAHPGQVDIRVTAKAPSEAEALALSEPVVQELQNRLGDNIYGQDEETLESVVCNLLNLNNLKLCLVESGLDLGLIKRIKLAQPDEMAVQTLEQTQKISQAIKEQIRTAIEKAQCDVAFGIALIMNEKVIVHFIYKDMQSMNQKTRTYGGPRDYAPLWAQNTGLDFLRRHLVTTIDNQKTGVL
ncbi:MAG: hypothetical protein SVT56_09435, partial [Chloroflexota bacterium]|nr:hypothetical protein [Chloroflexota bacterium]